jgi:dihydroflavonol-4-reductase
MKILVVGGTGLIGGDVALRLQAQGHEVTIGARKPAPQATAMAEMKLIIGDYVEDGFSVDALRGFDAVIFAAGSDIRHVKQGLSEEEHWLRANAQATPRFFERARRAGVRRAVLVGSFYFQAAPHLIAKTPYIAARHQADLAVRSMAGANFNVCSVNPPYVIGTLPGLIIPSMAGYTSYAMGKLPVPRFAPPGGANFISTASLSTALVAALERGDNGKAYLVGDQNLSFRDYLEEYFKAVGDLTPLMVRDQEHPFFPDSILYAGRGGTVCFEANGEENAFLGYRRNDIRRAVEEIVAYYRPIVMAQQPDAGSVRT